MASTAILIDGAFFLARYSRTFAGARTPERVAKNLFTMCIEHLDEKSDLYRIFFYDCPPLSKKAHNPVTGKAIDFSKTDEYKFRTELHRELVKLRKVALRLGRLGEKSGTWVLKAEPTKELLAGKRQVAQLTESDVRYDVRQKGVDMRIGLDIASMAFKRLVRRIVLVTGDADFVPAAKFARGEGLDVILDPMWKSISEDLFEHIDGLKSVCPKPKSRPSAT
jgi:uncharacterized LabA/DUF88 family protein